MLLVTPEFSNSMSRATPDKCQHEAVNLGQFTSLQPLYIPPPRLVQWLWFGLSPQQLLALVWVGQADRRKEKTSVGAHLCRCVRKGCVQGAGPPLWGTFHPWPKLWSIPRQPWVRAAAYDPWAKCEACRLDGDLRGGIHWLGGGGSNGGSGGLWEYGRRGL